MCLLNSHKHKVQIFTLSETTLTYLMHSSYQFITLDRESPLDLLNIFQPFPINLFLPEPARSIYSKLVNAFQNVYSNISLITRGNVSKNIFFYPRTT